MLIEINTSDIATLNLIVAVLADPEWTLEKAENLRNLAVAEKELRISKRPHNRIKKAARNAKDAMPTVKLVVIETAEKKEQ